MSRDCHVISNHWSFNCLLNSLCGPTSMKHQSPGYWPFVGGIHRSPVNSPHKGPVTRKKTSIWWRHHCISVHIFFRVIYSQATGGVMSVPAHLFRKLNGFSLRFWGWGNEDDDMASRWVIKMTSGHETLLHFWLFARGSWSPSQYKDGLSGYGVPTLKIRRSRERLIFNVRIPMVRWHIYFETAPWSRHPRPKRTCSLPNLKINPF